MADQDHYKTWVCETRTTDRSAAGMALLVGGLVVAVGFILWLVSGAAGPVATTATDGSPRAVIETPAAPAGAPAADTVDPVPEAAAPADGSGTEPAEPAAPADT